MLLMKETKLPVRPGYVEVEKDGERVYEPTPEERDKDLRNKETETLKAENKLLKAQLKASSEYSEFMEDCLVETAMVAYEALEKVNALIAAQTP